MTLLEGNLLSDELREKIELIVDSLGREFINYPNEDSLKKDLINVINELDLGILSLEPEPHIGKIFSNRDRRLDLKLNFEDQYSLYFEVKLYEKGKFSYDEGIVQLIYAYQYLKLSKNPNAFLLLLVFDKKRTFLNEHELKILKFITCCLKEKAAVLRVFPNDNTYQKQWIF